MISWIHPGICIYNIEWSTTATFMPCRVHIIDRNRTPEISDFVDKFTWVVVVWLAFRAAADLIICFTMSFLLHTRRTGFKQYVGSSCLPHPVHALMAFRSDTALNTMMLWIINTGVITALTSFTSLVIVGSSPLTLIFQPCYVVVKATTCLAYFTV